MSPILYFIISITTISMASFLANEINTTRGDTMGPTAPVQIISSLKDKKMQGIRSHVFWDVDE